MNVPQNTPSSSPAALPPAVQQRLGASALASLSARPAAAPLDADVGRAPPVESARGRSRRMFAPKAKAVIYLHMSGAPPQHDLFDYKPKLDELNGKPCPEEFIKGERFAFIKGAPKLLGTPYKFEQHGQSGAWISELLPHFAEIVDDLAVVRSMYDRPVQPRPGRAVPLHRLRARRQRVDGLVGHLRARLREPGPARLRRAALRRHRSRPAARACWSSGSCRGLPGRAVPLDGRADPVRRRTRRA